MIKKEKKILFGILSAIFVCTIIISLGRLYYVMTTPVTISESFRIYIRPEYTTDSVIDQIRRNDPDAELKGLKIWLKHRNYDQNVHSGCYTITNGLGTKQVADILTGGYQTPVRLTINSVRTVSRMSSSIASQLMLDSADVYYRLTDPHYLDSLGYSPETAFCMIIPNTYEVWWNISPDALFRRLIQETEKFWNDSRKEKVANMGMTINQVMTLASIVEEETSKSEELPVVAGLYINRLKRGMPLQADPTVIFALGGERPQRVLNTHLEIDSPYNTYRITGLPPAPIRFVNIRSIDAVLNHSQHNYYYMCAKEDFSGYHNFAVTLSQHNLNAARYRNALNKAGVK